MGRLIRHIVFFASMFVLMPGMAFAQLIQNTATGELNNASLDLSLATVTLNRTSGLVDPDNSGVTVDRTVVVADGIAFSTITVTLRDANNLPLGGLVVSLASSRGALDMVTQPLNPTDANGVTTGEIRSTLTGNAQITATDVAASVLLTEQPQVLFTSGEVLQLTKTVNPDKATVGDIVTYAIGIQNTVTNTVGNVRIADEASPVLAYLPGTARLDGNSIADPLPGPPMVFDIGDVQPLADTNGNGVADPGEGGYHTLSYSMVVGAGARIGSYGNFAVAIDVCDICTISAPTSVDLEVIADPIFDLGTIIGKVFNDMDGDGWQDRGEPGISGAMVALDSGTYALTDAHGRYHFPAIKPGQRMVKLNLKRIAGNARATGGDKKVLTVTPGLLAKANFGVNYDFETESIGHELEHSAELNSVIDKPADQIEGSASDLSAAVKRDTGDTATLLTLSGGAFVYDSTELTDHAKNLLRETAEIMRMYPDGLVQVNGHTDPRGSRWHNLGLSEGRAKAAFDYLVNVHDFSPERFIVKGFSEDDPIVSNESEAGRKMNRRVEIILEFTDADQARRYGTRQGVERVDRQATVDIGRGIDPTIALSLSQLIKVSGMEDRPPGAGYAYRLIAKTDVGNYVELDGKALEVDAKGRFESQVNLTPEQDSFVLSVRNAKGFVRYATVQLLAEASDYGAPNISMEPIPKLVLQLPPKGVAMRNANLVVPGYTDPGNSVKINGQPVEVDERGHFITSVSLRLGTNSIVTVVTDSDGYTGSIRRDIEYTGDALFIMALADGKVSQITREGNLQAAGADSYDEVKTEGRVALYLKGTVLGKYLITAAFDTGSSDIDKLFSELDTIENQRLVTNLDPDTIYPVYGDDSTLVYDSESQGKLYLALEGEHLDAVVGNYALNFTDTELTAYQRTLYGVRAAWRSQNKTVDNEPNTEAEVFVAEVDQVPVRDEILATGGSLYFLSQTDIIQGSEQVSLLVRDQHTGLLLQRITQQPNVDYNIKYREGRIWFTRPISSVVADDTLIGSNLLAGNPVTIQVDYETRVDGLEAGISGARFKKRFADGRWKVGGIHVEDDGGSGQYTLDGLDAELKLETARIVAEYAQSEGTDSLVFRSDDGGLQFSPVTAGTAEDGAAYKLAAEFDAGAWFGAPNRLLGSAYYKHLDAGFISNGNFSLTDDRQYGAVLSYKLNDRNSLRLRIDDQLRGQSASSTQTTLNWSYSRDHLVIEGEYLDRQVNDTALSGSTVAARAQYEWTDRFIGSLEYQQSVSGDARTQSAAGVEYAFKENLLVSGRIVMGSDGEAFQAGASWDTSFGRLYAQQQFGRPESSDDSGNTLLGAEAPFGAGGTVYTEYQWDRSGEKRGLRSIAGIRRDWSVTEGLSLLVSGEQTTLQAPGGGENELNALIGGASFERNGIKLSTRNEWRRQRGLSALDQFASFNHGELKMSSGLTLLGEYRHSRSDDLLQQDQSTKFQEASLGFAVRPIDHDRWNVLFKLSRLDNDATPAQVDSRYDDSIADLVATDWSVQLHQRIEWVGKQAFKRKVTEPDGLLGIETNTSLSIQRLNFDIPWNLTFGTEYRRLYQKESDDVRSGWLGELMWNGFEHLGVGVGYNFTDFSSNLRLDSGYSEQGWFLRMQGKY